MHPRLKVLVSAYACNPYRGSEHGVGWGWVNMIARRHDVWVLTADFQRHDIERELSGQQERHPHLRFCYVPAKPWFYKPTKTWLYIENSALKPFMNFVDSLWLREAYKLAKTLHEKVHFDLVHQLTWVGFRFPGHLWRLEAPFVWGPIGGLENTPWRLLPLLGVRGALYYAARNIINSSQKNLLPNPKRAFRRASGNIIAATNIIRDEILRHYGEESHVICEIGPPGTIAENFSTREAGKQLRIAWSAQHLSGKALPLLLHALAKLHPEVDWHLDILGEGPCTPAWRSLTQRLGIQTRCEWLGWLPRPHALCVVHRAHLFAITSLKDLTSTVLLEALSQGVPVLTLDHCGFSSIVDENCGVKISVDKPRQISRDLASAISWLWRDEPRRRRMGAAALAKARRFSWQNKADTLDDIYSRAIQTYSQGAIALTTSADRPNSRADSETGA